MLRELVGSDNREEYAGRGRTRRVRFTVLPTCLQTAEPKHVAVERAIVAAAAAAHAQRLESCCWAVSSERPQRLSSQAGSLCSGQGCSQSAARRVLERAGRGQTVWQPREPSVRGCDTRARAGRDEGRGGCLQGKSAQGVADRGRAAWSNALLGSARVGACASSGRAWHLWAARHSQEVKAGPLGAQLLPRLLEPAASNIVDSTAFV